MFEHGDGADDKEQMGIVWFDLGVLMRVDHILHRQRVKAKHRPQFLQQMAVTNTVDVDPGDRMLLQ